MSVETQQMWLCVQLSRDLPQLIIMKILQSGFDLRVTRADCRFLNSNAPSLGSNSSYCSRGSCSMSSNYILLCAAEYILTPFWQHDITRCDIFGIIIKQLRNNLFKGEVQKILTSKFLDMIVWDGFFNFQSHEFQWCSEDSVKGALCLISLTSEFFFLFCRADHELNSPNN